MDQIDALAKLLRTSANLLRRLMIEDGFEGAVGELADVSHSIDEAARRIESVVAAKGGDYSEATPIPRSLS